MIKVIIIEDEKKTREGLKKLIKLTPHDVSIVAETAYIKEAEQLIQKKKPDLIFLDIELEDGTGFELLKQINFKELKIIFTTAYNQFAIKAFKFNAIDYLLKPIDIDELDTAIENATTLILNDKERQNLLQMVNNTLEKENQKIVLKTTENRFILKVEEVICIQADGAYSHFYTVDNKITVSKNLKFYQDLLDETIFIRCHHSYLVNKNHIKAVDSKGKIILSNKLVVPISTRKKAEITEFVSKL